jgi:hypothetical protein
LRVAFKQTILVALLACLTFACTDAPPSGVKKAKKDENPEANCAGQSVVDSLRDQVFDAAIAEAKEGTQNLNNLRASVIGRIESPVLQGHDDLLKKTQCGGKFVIPLPPTTRKAFDGAASLTANISYSVQPAADTSGLVVIPLGIEPLISTLVAATQKRRPVAMTPPPMRSAVPRLETGDIFAGDSPVAPLDVVSAASANNLLQSPSFSCKGTLNRVERMICNDPMLADQDRAMAGANRDARNRTPEADKPKLKAENQKFIARRNSCADSLCVAAVYDDWTAALYNWAM